ncbi:MAG: antibiotic biosynthesis monooxygenase [Acidimicrobiia bacterium]|nr:antibiotic biosynthesis monooxygenase [Acidimicrobiia bacterium]
MATILAHITVKPGCESVFESIAARLFRRTHDDETAVRRYEYWRGAEPRTYYTLLAFDDFNGFLAHQTSPHHENEAQAIRDAVETLTLEWVDPIVGASPLVPTEDRPSPDGADELVRRYANLYAPDVQEWWLAQR